MLKVVRPYPRYRFGYQSVEVLHICQTIVDRRKTGPKHALSGTEDR